MQKKATHTFRKALRSIRKDKQISLLDLGLQIDSDASHISKLEKGSDVTLSTMIKLANALEVSIKFGPYVLKADPATKKRPRRKPLKGS